MIMMILKKNYIPTYTRYWDNSSKVPFIFNTQKGIWITYDDLESNTIKNNYILQQKLLGAMFWEFSCDRTAEIIGNTYSALFGGPTPTQEQQLHQLLQQLGTQVQQQVKHRLRLEQQQLMEIFSAWTAW